MANYASPPDNRIPYDLDGTVWSQVYNSVVSIRPNTDLVVINDESDDFVQTPGLGGGNPTSVVTWALVFPFQYNLTAYYLNVDIGLDSYTHEFQTSSDTTNGIDGTWTSRSPDLPSDRNSEKRVFPNYRVNTHPMVVANVKGVRFIISKTTGAAAGYFQIFAFHLFGRPVAPSFLQIYDPVLNQEVAPSYFDWGDIPQSSNDTRTFRVHNASSLLAQNVTLSLTDITPGVPDQASWHYLSLDGVNYFSSVNIGNLGAGFTSGIIYVQRVTPANAQLGPTALRVVAATTFI